MSFDTMIAGQVIGLAHRQHTAPSPEAAAPAFLDQALRLLLRARSKALSDALVARHRRRVLTGPFAGMDFTAQQSEGALCPKLLGTYEAELHPALQALAAQGLERIFDVGCAEGYYAVGLARLFPQARVDAYDIDPKGRTLCAELGARNGVADRVRVRERFSVAEMAAASGGKVAPRTLVFMDVEGAELELLADPAASVLRHACLIVETHPHLAPGVLPTLQARFAATHAVETLFERLKPVPPDAFEGRLLALDQFAATWEWRGSPTPWLVMTPHEG